MIGIHFFTRLWFYLLLFGYSYWSLSQAKPEYVSPPGGAKCRIDIQDVTYRENPYAYATVPEKGERSAYMPGLIPTVIFSLTNISGHRAEVAVPNYFYISTEFFDKHRPSYLHFENRCRCYVAGYFDEPKLVEGDETSFVWEGEHGKVGDKYTLMFGTGETRQFEVAFSSAMFPANEEHFRFCGFTQPDRLTRLSADLAFDIDVQTGKVRKLEMLRKGR